MQAQDFEASWQRILELKTGSRNASLLFVLPDAQAFNAGWLLVGASIAADALQHALQARLPDSTFALRPRADRHGVWVEISAGRQAADAAAPRRALMAQPLEIGSHSVCLRLAHGNDVGVHANDARTLSVHLERPVAYFMLLLAHPACGPCRGTSLSHSPQRNCPRRFGLGQSISSAAGPCGSASGAFGAICT